MMASVLWHEGLVRLQKALVVLHAGGIPLLIGLAIGWALASWTRWTAFRKALARESSRKLDRDTGRDKGRHSVQVPVVLPPAHVPGPGPGPGPAKPLSGPMPVVTLVMPAKNVAEHLLTNWQSQVLTDYAGRVVAYIVVGRKEDAAYEAALSFRDSVKAEVEVHVVVAGKAKGCSQKIHNQLAGLAAAPEGSDYIFFLDDDVELAPSTIGSFVAEMQARPEAFLVTGYPLDIPSDSLATYAAAAFHLPLSIVFSSNGRTTFVWGGCMFFRAADLRRDAHGVISALKSGGYSDDMTVGSVVTASGVVALCPGYSLFLQRLPSRMSFLDVWHYIHRQIFTCMTYSSLHNLAMNQFVMWLHCLLSTTLVVSLLRSALVVCVLAVCSVGMCPGAEFPTRLDALITGAHVVCLCICAWALRAALANGILLCCLQGGRDLDSKKVRAMLHCTNPLKVWTGLLVLNAMYPLAALVALLLPDIVWSGIKYRRRHGKISIVE